MNKQLFYRQLKLYIAGFVLAGLFACSGPKMKPLVEMEDNGEWKYETPKSFFIYNNNNVVTQGSYDFAIYDSHSGKKLIEDNSEIKGIWNNRLLIYDDIGGTGIWDAKNQQNHPYSGSFDNMVIVLDNNSNIKHIVENKKGRYEDVFIYNYTYYLRINEADENGNFSDSVTVEIYKTDEYKPAFSFKLTQKDDNYRVSTAYWSNSTIIIRDDSYLGKDFSDEATINTVTGEIIIQYAPKYSTTGKSHSATEIKRYNTNLFSENVSGYQVITPGSFTPIDEYNTNIEDYSVNTKRYGVFTKSLDGKLYLSTLLKKGTVAIYSKEEVDYYPKRWKLRRLRNWLIVIGSIIAFIALVFWIDKIEQKKAKGNKNKEPADNDQPSTSLMQEQLMETIAGVDENNPILYKIALNCNAKVKYRLAAIEKISDNNMMQEVFDKTDNDRVRDKVAGKMPDIKALDKTPSDLSQMLINASLEGYDTEVIKTLKMGADINSVNENGASPLFIASFNGNTTLVRVLVQRGADINQPAQGGATPLYVAVQQGHDYVAKHLLKNGADSNIAAGQFYDSPLTVLASENGNVEIAKLLLDYGANINFTNSAGISALYFSAQNNYLPLAKLLIENGASINLTSKAGATPLFIAAQVGNTEIAELLIKHGANKEISANNGCTPLQIANENGHFKIAALLQDGVKEKHQTNASSFTGEVFGSQTDVELAKKYLQNYGEKAKNEGVYSIWSWVDSRTGETNYQFLRNVAESNIFEFESPGHVSERTMLYEAGTMRTEGRELADGPNWAEKDRKRETELAGGNLEEKLFEAIEAENINEARELIDKGANINAVIGYKTPLLEAADTDNIDLVKLILDSGADVNYKNPEGFPLIALIAHEHNINTKAIIKKLIKAGADIYATNARGTTAIELIQYHHRDFIL